MILAAIAKILLWAQELYHQEDGEFHSDDAAHHPPMDRFCVVGEGEYFVANIVQQTYGDGHHRTGPIVVHPNTLQQPYAKDVHEIGEGANHYKFEYQPIVSIFKNQMTIRLEIEQHTDNRAQQRRKHKRFLQRGESQQEPQKGENYPPECCIQYCH